jgi:hypothetical protein
MSPREASMMERVFRYTFRTTVPPDEIRTSLHLAALAAEGVYGQAQVRLDAGYAIDEKARTCVVDATTAVGQTVAQIFTGLLTREFGEEAFEVERAKYASQNEPNDGRG